jgi:DNA-binding response OmpR family regulator
MDKPAEASRQARGFALYVGLDEATAHELGVPLKDLVAHLKSEVEKRAPGAGTHATIALAPEGTVGDDLEIVRVALHDPGKLQAMRKSSEQAPVGVTIDISRKRVVIGSETLSLTYREFELLQFLVLREGQTVPREAIIDHLWDPEDDQAPNLRTIDVHIRRMRQKLEPYSEIVRTVRGAGYRFDRHADVTIVFGQAPSPDMGV